MRSTLLSVVAVSCMAVLCVAVLACAPEPEPEAEPEAAGPEAALEELRTTYVENYNAGNAEAVVALYTDDAVALYADGSVNDGREAIAAKIDEAMGFDPTLQIEPADTEIFNEWAVQWGSYSLEMTPPAEAPEGEAPAESKGEAAAEGEAGAEAQPVSFGGSYMTVFRHVEDAWKIGAVITNYDSPPPAGLPAAAGPGEEETPEELADNPIAELIAAHEEHFASGDPAAVAADYSEDAVAAFGDEPAAVGRDAIQEAVARGMQGGEATLDIHTVGAETVGDGSHVAGGWYEIVAPDGQQVEAGNWIAFVTTADDGSMAFQWVVTNVWHGEHGGSDM